MCALASLLAVTLSMGQGSVDIAYFNAFNEKAPRFQVQSPNQKIEPPKKSPKQGWIFEYTVGAYGRQDLIETTPFNLRFRLFSQMQKERNDPAHLAARQLIRLWDYNVRRLNIEHSRLYNNGLVDVYFCFGGDAGGEQLFDEEIEGAFARKVNTIYIYRVTTFTDPLEMAREVAHEYGHAVLPPVGGFQTPENWGNGYLGEKLYLRYLRDEIAAKRLDPADAMGASLASLNAYVAKEVDPLMKAVADSGPNRAALQSTGPKAMNAYLGLALYMESLAPAPVFARSLKLIGSVKAADYPAAMVAAISERPSLDLKMAKQSIGKPQWIPLPPRAKIVSGAKLQARKGDWAIVVPSSIKVVVQNP